MSKKITTFELNAPQKPVKKKPKKKASIKSNLHIIIPVTVLIITVISIAAFISLNASKVENESINVSGETTPVSAAVVVGSGFTSAVPDD